MVLMHYRFSKNIAYLFVLITAIFSVYKITQHSDNQLRKSARQDAQHFLEAAINNCESAKADRIDNARAATAQADYLARVLAAASVKKDVKDAASKGLQLWSESANQQRRRLYDCKVLVYQHKKVIDKDALLEAQGQL
jgi:hypothetical protein